MPLIYPEPDPKDEFTAADWVEAVAGSRPGGPDLFTDQSGSATIVVHVPARKVRSMRKFVIGHSRAYAGAPYKLFRSNPPRHPLYPEMRACKMAVARLSPGEQPTDAGGVPVPGANPQLIKTSDDPAAEVTRYAAYEKAEVTIAFDLFPYEHLSDDDPAWQAKEYLRNTTIFDQTEARLEVIMAETTSFLEFTEGWAGGPTVGQAFGGTIGEYQVRADLTVVWHAVAHNFVFDRHKPTKLLDGIGCVNHAEFLEFPAGVLLLGAPRIRRYRVPLWAQEPIILYDIALPYQFFDPPQGPTNPTGRGHNTFPYSRSGKYGSAKRRGTASTPYLPKANFENVFTHVLDTSKAVRV